MKISYGSDIHLEFGYLDPVNKDNANVLVLAGDICVERTFLNNRCEEFFNKCSDEFEHVIYLVGNHEYYHGKFEEVIPFLKKKLEHRKNIHLLNNEIFEVDGFRFIGSTLWTDLNKNDPISESYIRRSMNDYRLILHKLDDGEGDRYLIPRDTYEEHKRSMAFLDSVLKMDDEKLNIVVTHHAPSNSSISENYKHDFHSNAGYRTELDQFIEDHDISVWMHGHTHSRVQYTLAGTVVLCNPRGYAGHEEIANDFEFKTLTIDNL